MKKKHEPLKYLQYQIKYTHTHHTVTHAHTYEITWEAKNISSAVLVYTWQTIINKRYNTTRKSSQ